MEDSLIFKFEFIFSKYNRVNYVFRKVKDIDVAPMVDFNWQVTDILCITDLLLCIV